MSVAVARVGDVAVQVRGVTYAKGDASKSPASGLIPVLRAGNITDQGLDHGDLVYVPRARVSARQLLQVGDVVIAASSGSLSVVGKAARVERGVTASFGAFCKVLRPGDGVDSGYFAHFFRTTGYRRRMTEAAAGANINNLRSADLDDLEIPLPPLSEQRRIARVLDVTDALRGAHRARTAGVIASLERGLVTRALEGDPGSVKRVVLDEIVDQDDRINYGVVQPGGDVPDGVALIRVGDLREGRIHRQDLKRIDPTIESTYARSRIRGSEILVACVGSIGEVAMVSQEDIGSNTVRGVCRVPISPPDLRAYVAAYLRTDSVQRYFDAELRTVAQPTLNVKQLRQTPLQVPGRDGTRWFLRGATMVDQVAALQRGRLKELDALFAALQHRAFTEAL